MNPFPWLLGLVLFKPLHTRLAVQQGLRTAAPFMLEGLCADAHGFYFYDEAAMKVGPYDSLYAAFEARIKYQASL